MVSFLSGVSQLYSDVICIALLNVLRIWSALNSTNLPATLRTFLFEESDQISALPMVSSGQGFCVF